jgi:hypothetical protein
MPAIEGKLLGEGAKDKVMEETTWHQMSLSIVIKFNYSKESSIDKQLSNMRKSC